MKKAFAAGADKICINTAAVKNPSIINKAANIFGSSNVVVAIENSYEKFKNRNLVYTNNGREITNKDTINWSLEVSKRGAGEIVITSIDKEGTQQGYQIDLIKKIKSKVSIPVIGHGGAGKIDDIYNLFKLSDCDAACMSSILHYSKYKKQKNFNDFSGNVEFVKKNNLSENITIKKLRNF